jgi:catechol 2,3-dioxygenase-like lactoylglutathione lyase family enzyme
VIEATPDQTENGVSAAGFGRDGRPDFWIGSDGRTTPPMHVAFVARSRKEVDAFHEAALAAGASDNGAPGPRPHYGEYYYAAFVRDLEPLDGHNIEAVCYASA